MLRTECAGCGSRDLVLFADLGETPLADVFVRRMSEAMLLRRYPLRAACCGSCDLAQLIDVVDDDLLYGDGYGFRTGSSPSSLAYMADLAKDAVGQVQCDGLIAEIGCNDGTLLDYLIGEYLGRGMVIGIDPSGGATGKPYLDGAILREPFTAELAQKFRGEAALVVAANVAAHVADPHDFLAGVSAMLAPGGVAVVEFQYFHDLLAGAMFDLIYHEHRFFYTAGTFAGLAAGHGLSVQRIRRVTAQGGSLRVTLARSADVQPLQDHPLVAAERERQPRLLAGFQARAEYARDRITETVRGYPGTVWGYGASAKSCTLLNFCGLGVRDLAGVADLTPGKLGRCTPGTGIRIFPVPHDEPDAYLLLVSNYLSGVLRREREFKGRFIVPLPLPVIV